MSLRQHIVEDPFPGKPGEELRGFPGERRCAVETFFEAEQKNVKAGASLQSITNNTGREWDGRPQVMLLNGKQFTVELEPDCCSAYVKPTVRIPVRYRVYKVITVREDQRHYMSLKLVSERHTILITVGGPIRNAEVPAKVSVRCCKSATGDGKTVSGTIEWSDGTTQTIVGGIMEKTSSGDRELIRLAVQAREDGMSDGDNPGWEYGFLGDAEQAERSGVCVTVQTRAAGNDSACQAEADKGDGVPEDAAGRGTKTVYEVGGKFRYERDLGRIVTLGSGGKIWDVPPFTRFIIDVLLTDEREGGLTSEIIHAAAKKKYLDWYAELDGKEKNGLVSGVGAVRSLKQYFRCDNGNGDKETHDFIGQISSTKSNPPSYFIKKEKVKIKTSTD